jgi:hypothetical protein
MRRFYKPSLWIPQHFLLTNPNLHHELLTWVQCKLSRPRNFCPAQWILPYSSPNNNQYAYYAAPSVPRRNLLVVDLPGSNETCPAAASFDDTAQRLGFDVICVNYSNLSSQNNICTGDPDCYGKVSQAKLDATSVCSIPGQSQCGIDPKTGRPYYLNNPADAVTQRISMMLQYLNTHGYNKNGTNWVTISQAQLLFGKILSWEGILRAEICRPSPPIRIRSRERSICRPHQRPH